MNHQDFTIYDTATAKPHSFYCRQHSLDNMLEECPATEVFNLEKGSSLAEDSYFQIELGSKVEQRTNATLGNLLEAPDYKFGESDPLAEEQDELELSGSLNDCSAEFSIFADGFCGIIDSEGEKSKPRVKERTVGVESTYD